MTDRPRYEAPEDRENELAAIGHLCREWNCGAQKLPVSYCVDFALVRNGRIFAWAEVKCRTNPSNHYPTYMIALNKIIAARRLVEGSVGFFILVVQFTDGLFHWRDYGNRLAIQFGGREDRGDWQDKEPVAMIPMSEFHHKSR